MIAGDRLALKANLQQGISQILQELVNLYSQNLNALGVQTSAVATVAIGGLLGNSLDDVKVAHDAPGIGGIYYALIQMALMGCLGCVVISTLAASYGPSLALTGKSLAMVSYGMI